MPYGGKVSLGGLGSVFVFAERGSFLVGNGRQLEIYVDRPRWAVANINLQLRPILRIGLFDVFGRPLVRAPLGSGVCAIGFHPVRHSGRSSEASRHVPIGPTPASAAASDSPRTYGFLAFADMS